MNQQLVQHTEPRAPNSSWAQLRYDRLNVAAMAGTRADLLDRPAPAVVATEAKGHTPAPDNLFRAQDMAHMAGIRPLTVAECARLQSFPDDWPWQGNKSQRHAQVGNAVPWPLACVIGEAIRAADAAMAAK